MRRFFIHLLFILSLFCIFPMCSEVHAEEEENGKCTIYIQTTEEVYGKKKNITWKEAIQAIDYKEGKIDRKVLNGTPLWILDATCKKKGGSGEVIKPVGLDNGKKAFKFELDSGEYEYTASIGGKDSDGNEKKEYEYTGTFLTEDVCPEGSVEGMISLTPQTFYVSYIDAYSRDPDKFAKCSKGADFTVYRIFPNGNEEVVEPADTVSAEGGGSKGALYILESWPYNIGKSKTYKYEVENVDQSLTSKEAGTKNDIAVSGKHFQTKNINCNFSKYYSLTAAVPKDSGLQAYYHPSGVAYAAQSEVDEKSVSINSAADSNQDSYTFTLPVGRQVDFVAGGPGTDYKRTAWEFTSYYECKEGDQVDLTFEMEKKGEKVAPADGDLYTNVKNAYLSLLPNEEVRLEGFRLAQTTANDTANRLFEPDMTFTPIYGADKIDLEPGGVQGRKYYTIKAKEGAKGIAILKVTYDEINVVRINKQNEPFTSKFSSIPYYNVGIIVVDLEQNSSNIETGLKIPGWNGDIDLRGDYDTVYIPNIIKYPSGKTEVNEEGTFAYEFTPPKGSVVSMHDPIHLDTEAITDEEWISPQVSEEGVVTLDLKEGRNIIKIETPQGTTYTTIQAKKTDITITNKTHGGKAPMPGDTLAISFSGLELPVYKMACLYNPGYSLDGGTTHVKYWLNKEVTGEDGRNTLEKLEELRGERSQYSISTRNTVEVTLPEAEKGTYVLSKGQIVGSHLGSGLWAHTYIPLTGLRANLAASTGGNDPNFCILPEITIKVEDTPVEQLEALIDEIDRENPTKSVRKIMEARAAYDALKKSERNEVSKEKLRILDNAYAAVESIIDVINRIDELPESGDVTGKDIKKINLVNTDYLDLSPEERQAVDNYSPKMESLMGLVNSVKAVEDLITAIPEESALTLNDAQKVADAVKAYNELDPVLVSAVDSRGRLPGLEKKISDLTAAREVDDAIGAIGTVTAENYKSGEIQAAILKAKNLQARLTEAQKGLVTKAKALEDTEKAVEQFRQAEPAREIQAIMDQISVLRTQEDGTPGPLSQVNSQETWKSWEGYVKNIRKAVDRLSAEQKGKITNISDLELAENCILSGNTGYAEKLIGSLPSEGEAAQRPLTEEELSAVAAAMDTYNSLTQEEKAKLTPEMVKKLNELNQKAAGQSTDGSYQKKMAEGFARQADEYFSLNKEGATSRTQIEDARKLVDQYEAYPADSRAVLDAMQDSQGVTYGQRMANLKAQTEALEREVQETEDLNRQISELPVIVDIDNADALLEEIAEIEQRYGNLSADGKSYVDLAVPNVLKGIAQSMKAEIEAFQAGAVAGVKASAASYNKVRLQWNSSSQAKSYIIQRKAGSGEWENLKTTGALSCTDNSVKTGTAYVYRVCAVSARWGDTEVQSQYGESGSVKPALSAAVLSKVQASGKRALKITWKRVNGASGYEIYRSTSKNGKFKKVKTLARGSATSFTNKNLSRNKAYYYKVRAYRKVDKKNVAGAFSGVKGAKTRKK